MSILFSQRLDAAEFSAVHSTVCSLDPLVVSFVWPRLSRRLVAIWEDGAAAQTTTACRPKF